MKETTCIQHPSKSFLTGFLFPGSQWDTQPACHKSFAPWVFVSKTDICPQNITEVREISLKVVLKGFYLVPVQFLSHRILFTSTLYP